MRIAKNYITKITRLVHCSRIIKGNVKVVELSKPWLKIQRILQRMTESGNHL